MGLRSKLDSTAGISSARMATHYFPTDRVHFTWDAGNEPVLTIADGDTVVFETRDVSDDQIGPDSDVSVIATLDWNRVYPLSGPVRVDGAEPGDTLAIEILDIHTKGWGWVAILPGLGLLADDFTEPYLRILDLSEGDVTHFREDITIPLDPFMGTMGVCPADANAQSIMPPGNSGGNRDTRQLVAGTTLYLPVNVAGALFNTVAAHCCQGDGEVFVTGIECPMYAALRFYLIKGRSIPAPQFQTPGPLTPLVEEAGWAGAKRLAVDSAICLTLKAMAVLAFAIATTRLPGHWSSGLDPLKATAQTVPSRVTTLAH